MGIRACSLAVLLFTGLAAAQEDAGTKAFRLGDYAEAERIYRAALVSPQTPDTVRRLADLYGAQGKNTDAEPLLIRLIELCEDTYGGESVEVASALIDLARMTRNLARPKDAVLFLQRAIAIHRKALGLEHLELAKTSPSSLRCSWSCSNSKMLSNGTCRLCESLRSRPVLAIPLYCRRWTAWRRYTGICSATQKPNRFTGAR